MVRRRERQRRRPNIWRSPLVVASMALAVIGCASYIVTVPALASAHEAAVPRVNARGRDNLGRTAGSVWGVVLARSLFGGSESSGGAKVAADGTVTLADGEQIKVTQVAGLTKLTASNSQGLIAAVATGSAAKGNASSSAAATSSSSAAQGSHAASSGSSSGSAASAGSSAGSGSSSTGSSSSGSASSTGPTEAQEAELHSWLVTKASALDGYVSRVNGAISTYRASGDTGACDALDGEILGVRAQFGRKYVSNDSRWAGQFEALWGCYTNLNIYVGSYGTDPDALTNYSSFRGRLAL